jgi:hypothetical protein
VWVWAKGNKWNGYELSKSKKKSDSFLNLMKLSLLNKNNNWNYASGLAGKFSWQNGLILNFDNHNKWIEGDDDDDGV